MKNTWHEVLGQNKKKDKVFHEDEWTGVTEGGEHMAAGERQLRRMT